MAKKFNFEKAKENILRESDELNGWPEIKGYEFSKGFKLDKFLNSYLHTGFQATNLKIAIDIIKKMKKEKEAKKENLTVFLGYTSNMVSSGLREVIAYLVKLKFVDVIVTTAGGIEEDIIKCQTPFVLGSFNADGKELRKKGINRIGNIFVPNNRYIEFEKLMSKFFIKISEELKQRNKPAISPSELIYLLGKEIDKEVKSEQIKENSILYWAAKNNIPVFCPAITDGSFGDMTYFYKKKNPDFRIDITEDIVKINDIAINAEKTGAIILGGSLPKHHIMNANMFRDGTDYTVYISTGSEGDGSMAGAKPEEAISWGKQAMNATSVMVEGDATIIFPLIVAGVFVDEKN